MNKLNFSKNHKGSTDPSSVQPFRRRILISISEDFASMKQNIRSISLSRIWRSLKNSDLPDGVRKIVWGQYLSGTGIFLFSCYMTIYYRNVLYLSGILVAVFLISFGIYHTMNYENGRITERALLCHSVRFHRTQKSSRLVFCTQDEVPSFFEFYYPGNASSIFEEGRMYVIYFNEHNPIKIIGYVPI